MATADSEHERAERSAVRRAARPAVRLASDNRAAKQRADRRTEAVVRNWLEQLRGTRQP